MSYILEQKRFRTNDFPQVNETDKCMMFYCAHQVTSGDKDNL